MKTLKKPAEITYYIFGCADEYFMQLFNSQKQNDKFVRSFQLRL